MVTGVDEVKVWLAAMIKHWDSNCGLTDCRDCGEFARICGLIQGLIFSEGSSTPKRND